jgi:transcriptional accessory protein Tex/SPT6
MTDDFAVAGKVAEIGWVYIVVPLFGLIAVLVGIVRHHDVSRLDEMKEQINKIDERQDRLTDLFHTMTVTAVRTEEQLKRLVGHTESEQRSRVNTSEALIKGQEALFRELASIRRAVANSRESDC